MVDVVRLSPAQQSVYDALEAFTQLRGGPQVITLFGYAGTGKTTLLCQLAALHPGAMLCTLTGKAASVLHRKTGLPASTLHSVFYKLEAVIVDPKTKREEMIWKEVHDAGALAGQLLMIDECMMVGTKIMSTILRTGVRVIAVGDPNQLWPVRDDAYFTAANLELTEIHRQALDNPIIRQAHTVRLGGRYRPDGAEFRVQQNATDEMVIEADIVLCWTHEHRHLLNAWARRLRGFHAGVPPQAGEPVMCLRNIHELGVYNGAIYTLLRPFNPGDPAIMIEVDGYPTQIAPVQFEGMEKPPEYAAQFVTGFAFGYACTVHKAAGSEWPTVLMFDTFKRNTPWVPERKRWLYTAITRASERITVVIP